MSTMPNLLGELSEYPDDVEHGSVAVSHESGAALEVGRSGHVVFTPDLEADVIEQFHLPPGMLDRRALIEAMCHSPRDASMRYAHCHGSPVISKAWFSA